MKRQNRREFLRSATVAGAGFLVVGSHVVAQEKKKPSDKLNVAIAGVGGRGGSNTGNVRSENIVALCDVNTKNLDKAAKRFPKAKTYFDWRKMFDQKDIEAVVCSTTDHTHAFVTVWAMRRGQHVYCEKPVAHSVYEARVVQDTYKEKSKDGVRTQMGTQIHAGGNYRRVVELIQSKAIGEVREAHVWCNRRGPCPTRPKDSPPVPEHLKWDLWLGPAPSRPYHPRYAPGCMTWEQWWEWGNGCLGDMGSHLIDLPFWALKLRQPLTVEAEGEPFSTDAYPHHLIGTWEHPATDERPALTLKWYDGGKRPKSPEGVNLNKWGIGCLFIGDKGQLVADYGRRVLLPADKFKGFQAPKPSIPRSLGHHREWLHACKTGAPTLCNFDYSGMLIEHNLLAAVAFRTRKKLEWDPENLKAKNCPEASKFIRRPYRKGWVLEG